MQDVVSVVMPSKDRCASLQRVLPSYLAEKEVREVIVVVDGSTDGTREYLRAMAKHEPRVKVLENGGNRGISYSKNRAIEAASGDYIFTGEDDLELVPGFFGQLFGHMERLGVDLISPRDIWRLAGESAEAALARADASTGRYLDPKWIAIKPELDLGEDTRVVLAPNPMLGPARIFKQIGFDVGYGGNSWREESDFQVSAQEAGYSIGLCPHATAFNCMVDHDRGGSHAAVGLRRVRWQVVNTWRFVAKHEGFVAEHFEIGNRYLYLLRFTARRIALELVLPAVLPHLSRARRSLRRLLAPAGPAGSDAGETGRGPRTAATGNGRPAAS